MPFKKTYNNTITCEGELKEQFDAALYGKSTKEVWQFDIDGFRNLGRPRLRAVKEGETASEIFKKSIEYMSNDHDAKAVS